MSALPEYLEAARRQLFRSQGNDDKRFPTPGALAIHCTAGREENPRHLALIDEAFTEIADGGLDKLLITMPPRHGKSFRASKWGAAWFLHRFPDKRVILCSYEADFAAGWGKKVREIIDDNDLGISVSKRSFAGNNWELAGRAGGMMTAGVGGPITGKGADLLIIDDPVKNREEANSEVMREKAWDWYRSTALTRLEPGGAVILIMTRWHEDDLAGRLLSHEGSKWRHINLPALAEDNDAMGRKPGEALWPDRFDERAWANRKDEIGAYEWTALYQQRPTPLEGGIFKRSWARYWSRLDDGKMRLGDRIVSRNDGWTFATVDLAASTKTSADWTVVATWFVTYDGDLILIDRERARIDETQHFALVRRQFEKHKLTFVAIESRMFGTALVYEAGRNRIPIRELKADTDKITRALPAAVRMESGALWFPADAPWRDEWDAEIFAFPNGSHDDQVDVMAYAAQQITRFGTGRRPKSKQLPPADSAEFMARRIAQIRKQGKKRSRQAMVGEV